MRQIAYDNISAIRLDFPPDWNPASVTGVGFQADTTGGASLEAYAAATVYTATTLNAAAAVGDSTITLPSNAGTLYPGDRLQIASGTLGPAEEVEVVFYNSSTKVATLKHELEYAHASAIAVRGLWATYSLDTSSTEIWTAGLQIVITWTPLGSAEYMIPIKERAEIAKFFFSVPDFARRFETRFPREWLIAKPRLNLIFEEAKRCVERDGLHNSWHIDRQVENLDVQELILLKARELVTDMGGETWSHEQNKAGERYKKEFDSVMAAVRWQDDNQDGVMDDDEIDVYDECFATERGI